MKRREGEEEEEEGRREDSHQSIRINLLKQRCLGPVASGREKVMPALIVYPKRSSMYLRLSGMGNPRIVERAYEPSCAPS